MLGQVRGLPKVGQQQGRVDNEQHSNLDGLPVEVTKVGEQGFCPATWCSRVRKVTITPVGRAEGFGIKNR